MRCKRCKKKFEPKKFLQKYCMEDLDCIKAYLESIKKENEKKRKEKQKKEKDKLKQMKINSYFTDNKKLLQQEVNKLSRKIDAYFQFKCIDCGNNFGKQTDAAHLHNVQGNENIRYNLHNLHSARSYCNMYSSEHKVGYRNGIIERYGKEYLEFIDIGLPKKYPYLGLNAKEVYEFLSVARKLNREFSKHEDNLKNGIQARDYFNYLLGIYK